MFCSDLDRALKLLDGDMDAFAQKCGYASYDIMKAKNKGNDTLVPCPRRGWAWVYRDKQRDGKDGACANCNANKNPRVKEETRGHCEVSNVNVN